MNKELLIKEYKYWSVYLHENKCYLGRVYIWAKRENALDFFDMTKEEAEEYFMIGRKLKLAFSKLFTPDLYNYATLANITPHLHTHFIPRYSSPRIFEGIEFADSRWGQNYAPYNKELTMNKEIIVKILNSIKKELEI